MITIAASLSKCGNFSQSISENTSNFQATVLYKLNLNQLIFGEKRGLVHISLAPSERATCIQRILKPEPVYCLTSNFLCNERMSEGLQESALDLWGITKTVWQLGVKSREQQSRDDVFLSLLCCFMSLCLLLFSFLHAYHRGFPARQRLRRGPACPTQHRHIIPAFLLFYEPRCCGSVSDDGYLCFLFPHSPGFSVVTSLPVTLKAPSRHLLCVTWLTPRDLVTMMASVVANGNNDGQSLVLKGVDPETCMIVFKNHWAQVRHQKV